MRSLFLTAVALISVSAAAKPLPPADAPDGATCRSHSAKHRFDVENGYPEGRAGYVVDHICALECGGVDETINMQYQTRLASIAKDRWERTPAGCASTCTPQNSTPVRMVFNCK